MRRWLSCWAPVAAQMTAIFLISGRSDVPDLPAGLSGYTGHAIGYAMLAALAVRAFAGAAWDGVTVSAARWAILLSSAYGVTDEIHQAFVANRFPGADDWAADTVGAILGAFAVVGLARRRRSRDARARDV